MLTAVMEVPQKKMEMLCETGARLSSVCYLLVKNNLYNHFDQYLGIYFKLRVANLVDQFLDPPLVNK